MSFVRKALSFGIIFQMIFFNNLGFAARNDRKMDGKMVDIMLAPNPSEGTKEQNQTLLNIALQAQSYQGFLNDPLVKELSKLPINKSELVIPGDVVDANPFWMHEQAWINESISTPSNLGETDSGLFSSLHDGKTLLHFAGMKRSLLLPTQFQMHGVSEDFIIMTKPGSEGLWFIGMTDAIQRSEAKAAVPVYFLPLPTSTLPIKSIHTDLNSDWLILESEGSGDVTVDLTNLRSVRDWQSIVLLMAQSRCIQDAACRASEGKLSTDVETATAQTLRVLPKKGAVGGNGFIPGLPSGQLGMNMRGFDRWMNLIFPKAQAVHIDDDTIFRVYYVFAVFGAMIATSAVLQVSVLKEKLARIAVLKEIERLEKAQIDELEKNTKESKAAEIEKNKKNILQLESLKRSWEIAKSNVDSKARRESFDIIERTFEELSKGVYGDAPETKKYLSSIRKAGRSVRTTFDVFGHLITAVANFGSVTLGNTVEYLGDRYLPQYMANENGLIRKFLDKTLYFTRGADTNNAVSAKTVWLGAVFSGTFDTAMVATQYLYVVPVMANWAAEGLPEDWQKRVEVAFDTKNPEAASIIMNDIIRNQLAWMQSGASGYSTDARQIEMPLAMKAVEAELKAKGLDPLDSKNQKIVKEMLEEKINRAMVRQGLPSANEHLFDISSVYQGVYKEFGYGSIEAGDKANSPIYNRPGLTKPTLVLAIEIARRMSERHPEPANLEMLKAFEELKTNFGILSSATKSTSYDQSFLISYAQRMYSVRKTLALLSMESGVAKAVAAMPQIFAGVSPEAMQRASVVFRFSLDSYMKGDGSFELADDFTLTENPRRVQRRAKKAEKSQDALTYKPGFWASWQIQRAETAALRAVAVQGVASGSEAYEKVFTESYRAELARTQRLSFSEGKHVDLANKAAMDAADEARKTSEVKALLDEGKTFEVLRFLARVHSLAFFRAYKENTQGQEMIPAMHVDQPGALQPIRRWGFVQKSKILTAILRVAEASFDNSGYTELGFKSWFDRSVPVWYEVRTGFIRSMKRMPNSLTSGYVMTTYFWRVNLSWATLALFSLVGMLIYTPQQYLMKVFQHVGYKPMNTTLSKTIYMLPYAWITFLGSFPLLFFAKDVQTIFPLIGIGIAKGVGAGLTAAWAWQLTTRLRGSAKALKVGYGSCARIFRTEGIAVGQ